ncbi:MAG: T9SS type A sorting domain-containing protein, partial [Bacteroidales bacterium]|nr:T9SS type A sorting domain-containing protein [Bacteroidales bacterium]
AGHGELIYHQEGEFLTLSWFSLKPFAVARGSEVLRIRFENTLGLAEDFQLNVVQPSEVANPLGKMLNDFNFLIPTLSDEPQAELNVYPNPSAGWITCSLEDYASAEVIVEVLDAEGRLIKSWRQAVQGGSMEVEKDLAYLNAGKYLLRIIDPSGKQKDQRKVVVIAR